MVLTILGKYIRAGQGSQAAALLLDTLTPSNAIELAIAGCRIGAQGPKLIILPKD